MLAFYFLTWQKKPENPEETFDPVWASISLPHADAANRTRTAAVSMGLTIQGIAIINVSYNNDPVDDYPYINIATFEFSL